ncbi:MAG TPA: flagellar basal-body MS-ring/collar protein FliF, partial [Candidatus Acidoferrum sp.]|nr:flagellar basal-body MS-ring/collar protein FliF [Candidatus Acidoferrum sp.]
LVPGSQVYETRIKLATAGLPQGGGVGFELFDRSSFGVTDFVQKLNYQRALQGELARTIGQIREVQQARVHIVLPQPTIFSDREKPATASVVLGLRPNGRLNPEQVRAIVHLVSGSVEGLDADHVTVIDSAGRMLSSRSDRGPAAGTASQYEYQSGVETDLQRRVQSMLEEVLGPGKASVRVAAQLEFSQGERTEERVDPNTVVKSEQRTTETTKGSSTRPNGVPGTTANLGSPPTGVSGTSSSNESVKEQESIQYEVGRVVERRTLVAGDIKRLSVAVLVDPPYRVTTGAKGGEQKLPVPRDKAELEKLRAMVMKAVGFNASRGDEVEVAELAFDTSAMERERLIAERAERTAFWWSLPKPAGIGFGILLLVLFGLRPLLAALRRVPRTGSRLDVVEPAAIQAAVTAQLKARAAAALNPAQLLKVQEREELHSRIGTLARSNPDQVAQLIRSWMVQKQS